MPLTVVRLHAPFNLLLVLGRIGCVRERFARFVSFVSYREKLAFGFDVVVSCLESRVSRTCFVCDLSLAAACASGCDIPYPISGCPSTKSWPKRIQNSTQQRSEDYNRYKKLYIYIYV